MDANALRARLRLEEQKCECAYIEWQASRKRNPWELNRAVDALVADFRSHSDIKATEVQDRQSLADYLRWIACACAAQVQHFREFLQNELLHAALTEIELIVATNVVRALSSSVAAANSDQLVWVH